MKKINIFTVLIVSSLMMFGLQSCKKYADDTVVTFVSKTERVANTWKVDNYKVNGTDFTSLVSSYSETFTKEKAYSYDWGLFNGSGSWAFQNSDKEIKLTGSDDQSSRTLVILKLEEKTFWYYYMDGNDKKEYHLIQK